MEEKQIHEAELMEGGDSISMEEEQVSETEVMEVEDSVSVEEEPADEPDLLESGDSISVGEEQASETEVMEVGDSVSVEEELADEPDLLEGGEPISMEEEQASETEAMEAEDSASVEEEPTDEPDLMEGGEPISMEEEQASETEVMEVEDSASVEEEPAGEPELTEGGEPISVGEKQVDGMRLMQSGEFGEPPADHPMNDLMEEALNFQKLRQGDIVDGQIVSVSPTEVLVDVGAKSEGVVRGKELEGLGREGLENYQVGHTLPVYVVRPEDRDGTLILSIRRAEEEQDWRQAQKLHEENDWFESQVAGFNKGGLIVRMGKLRGFVPASQLSRQHQGRQNQQPEERWAHLVGTPIRVKVIEINRKRKRLILSERAALRGWREAQKAKLLEELREGEVRRGVVSSLSDFGAFVDLGGADGLVHLSELSWNRSAKPADVLQPGQDVEVYVLGVNREKKRIALSLKRLEPEPWATVESRYYVGQLVEGAITRLTNFGAFALVNDEIEGLIHISELSDRRINHPQEVVSEGEKHVMRIIRIDPKRRRMGLSLMRVADPAYADLDWRAELAEAEDSLEQEEVEDLIEEDDLLDTDEIAS